MVGIDSRLLPTDREKLFLRIKEAGFDPTDFEWSETSDHWEMVSKRPSRRHNLCGPLDGIRVSAILKKDSLADYLVEYGRLRRLDDALHWMRFSVRDSAAAKPATG